INFQTANKKPTLVSQDSLPFGWPLSIKDAQSMSHSSANWPASSPDQRLFGSLTLLEGHSTSVKGVLRCTDPTEQLGQLIISWADEPDICVWSLASRRVVQRLSGHTGRVVACVAHEPAGQLASSGLDPSYQYRVLLHSLSNSQPLLSWRCQARVQKLLVLGDCLLAAGEGLYAFGLTDGAELAELDSGLASRTWRRWGRRHLAAAYDRHLRLFRVGGGGGGGGGPLAHVCNSADSHRCAVTALVGGIGVEQEKQQQLLFASASLDGEVVLWSAATVGSGAVSRLERLARFNRHADYEGEQRKFPHSVCALRRLGDRYLLAGVGYGFAVFDLVTGRTVVAELAAHRAKVSDLLVLTSPSGQLTVATAGEDASIRLWHLRGFEAAGVSSTAVASLAAAAAAAVSAGDPAGSGRASSELAGELYGHTTGVRALLDCGSEAGLVSFGLDHLIYLWSSDQAEFNWLFSAAAAAVQDCPG
uniref:WD_REPEATS_REGION domain-containing protein n=1 Tax=Macrostomum lignano TaxID=282301 RepID=A0A1I8GG33_9PLAT